MMNRFTTLAKIRERLTGKKLFSKLRIMDEIQLENGEKRREIVSESECYDSNGAGDITITICRKEGEPRIFKNENPFAKI